MNKWLLFNILVGILLFSGCGSSRSLAPVLEHNQPPSTKVSYHVVAPGETLYSIAWRYNLDYKRLARSNNIGASFKIYPGQKIYLSKQSLAQSKPTRSTPNTNSQASLTPKTNTQVSSSGLNSRLKNKSPEVKKNTKGKRRQSALTWSWPTRGSILNRFNSNNGLNKGVDIAGNLGEPVRAASSGTVVYSGEGLRGFGKLIIIKHSEKYLSAYAHNRRLLASEGDEVERNEKIAEMGQSGTDRVKLHFEIRYDGKPVDPLAYLPSSK